MAKRRLFPRVGAMAVTFMIAITLLVPAAYLVAPVVHRQQTIRGLTSQDLDRRERSLNQLMRLGAHDAALLRGAVEALGHADRENFLQIASAMEVAGLWGRRHVPDDAWLRWLEMLATQGSTEARLFAAQRLGDLTHRASDPTIRRLLTELIGDTEPDVRYNALVNAAALSGADGRASLAPLIVAATGDAEPRVARHAWILLGVLRHDPLPPLDWKRSSPQVVEAMLWAHAQVHPEDAGPLLAALTSVDADPDVRAAAVYALHFSTAPQAQAGLLAAAAILPSAINQANQRLVWRAILSLPRPDLTRGELGRLEEVIAAPAWDEGDNPLVEPIALASVYRMGIAGVRRPTADPDTYDLLLKLATVEGQQPPYMHWPLTGFKPPLLRVQTVAVSTAPHIGDLRPAFLSPIAPIRDLACLVAADKFNEQTLEGMIADLIGDYSDEAKMSAAILSGITGLRADLIRRRMVNEHLWSAQQVQRLGLWMQGAHPELDGRVQDLLLRDEVPTTTVLLAMLHRGERVAALDYLLNPRGEPRLDLVELFDQARWWHVLRRYLPADAPPFWPWADPQLEAFQVDVIRDWYLVRRASMR
jgi:hypothetical protein